MPRTTNDNLPSGRQQNDFAADINAAINASDIKVAISTFCEGSRFREFAPVRSAWGTAAVEQALQAFLRDGKTELVEKQLAHSVDTSDALHDLALEISSSGLYSKLVDNVVQSVAADHPSVAPDKLENRASGAVFEAFMSEIKARDQSRPLDAMRGNSVSLVYIPFHDNLRSADTTKTSWWGDSSDAINIKPDQVFINFMKLANVSKQAWFEALREARRDVLNDGDLSEKDKRARAAAWSRANWSVSGEPLVEVQNLVEAVDLCTLGFTPFIAFNMDAYKLVNRKWQQGLAITGGILGLHDFAYGSGNPIRFEGQCVVPAKPRNFLLHDRIEHNLAKVHGFTNAAFHSKVKDTSEKKYHVEVMEAQITIDATAPQLDLATIAESANYAFATDISELIDIMDATGLEIDALDDALITAVISKKTSLIEQYPQAMVRNQITRKADEQAARLERMTRSDKIAALAGLYGPDHATTLIRDLSGWFGGPGL